MAALLRRSAISSTSAYLNQGSSEQCIVCLMNDTSLMELDWRPCCDQPICQTCLETYIRSKLEVGVIRVGCPNPECDSLIQVEELTRLEPELVHLFYRRLVDANADPYRKTCPNCCLVTEVEPPRLNERKALEYGLLINCTECQFRWCFQCHGPQHQGLKCDSNRTSDKKLQKWARRKQAKHVPTAQCCPVCKVTATSISSFVYICIRYIALRESA